MQNRYDIIVVGAGHNGLTVANYLRRGGFSVAVLEQARRVGGNAITTEPLRPGFFHNPHANYLAFCDIMPMMADLSLASHGLTVMLPKAQFGMAFADGRPPVLLYSQDICDATVASFKVYSKKDARTYQELRHRCAPLAALIRQGLYSTPNIAWFDEQRRTVNQVFGDMLSSNVIGTRSARRAIDELFRSPEIRMLFYQLALDCGIALDEVGGDLAFFGYALWIAGRWRLPLGGMQSVSNALCRAAVAAGVEIYTACSVKRIVLDNKQAVGVLTDNDTKILATRAIVGALPVSSLLSELVGAEALSSQERGELARFERAQGGGTIASSMFCLSHPPQYKSARHDASINRCFKTTVGFDTPDDIVQAVAQNNAGMLPRPAGTIRVNTAWDFCQAPAGMQVAGADSSLPPIESMGAKMWQQIEESFAQAFYDVWVRHTQNLNAASVDGMLCNVTAHFERRILFRLGASQYRTSIGNLYICGPGTYPGGGVHGANAYNASAVILSDLSIPR
jgi:phytoene dehydrogenase-like protein